jgi:hypothetical protein
MSRMHGERERARERETALVAMKEAVKTFGVPKYQRLMHVSSSSSCAYDIHVLVSRDTSVSTRDMHASSSSSFSCTSVTRH